MYPELEFLETIVAGWVLPKNIAERQDDEWE